MRIPLHRAIATAAALTIAATACGATDDGATTVDLASGLPSAAVCNGEPSSVNPPATDPISGYVYLSEGEGEGWTTGWFDTFGDQHALIGDEATLILCVTVTESTEGFRCPFEDDGETFELVRMNATYAYSMRNADTANEIARGTASAPAEECPTFTSWSSGEGERRSWPTPTEGDLEEAIDVFFG